MKILTSQQQKKRNHEWKEENVMLILKSNYII